MKLGKSLVELATEIQRQQDVKVDMIAPTSKTQLQPLVNGETGETTGVALALAGQAPLDINNHAHGQIGTYTGVPAIYYKRMLEEAPDLLASNVNHWLAEKAEKRMVRTLDGRVRAYLSDVYRTLDNFDLAEVVLPVLGDLGVELISCDVTETRLYLKAVDKRIKRDVPTGRKIGDGSHVFFDTCSPLIVISNSEVGAGRLSVDTGTITHMCTNLAITTKGGMKRRHVGARHEIGMDGIEALLTDETKRASDKAVWLQVRDVVSGAFNEERFNSTMDEVAQLSGQPIESDDVVAVVKQAGRTLGVTEDEQKSVLKHLISGGDLTRYGVMQAITRTAEDAPSYDRASELEKIGGDVVTLAANDWRAIAKAA